MDNSLKYHDICWHGKDLLHLISSCVIVAVYVEFSYRSVHTAPVF